MNIDALGTLLGEGDYNWVYGLKNNHNQAIKIAKQSSNHLHKEVQILTAIENTHQFPKVHFTSFRS